jgi:hypothetical protein
MNKYAIFAFRGDSMCFVHVLLNALDLKEKGADVKIVMEGESVTLIQALTESKDAPFLKAREMGLIDGVCRACSFKLGALQYNEASGIPLKGDMSGHPSFSSYIKEGYEILTL